VMVKVRQDIVVTARWMPRMILLTAVVVTSLLAVGPAPDAQAELPLCAPLLPRPVRDGRFVRARHKIVCNKEMLNITVVGILTRTYDRQTYYEIDRRIKHCSLASTCTARTRGTIVVRRRQWFHAWARGFAIYECKPEEARYCTRKQRRERKHRKIVVTRRRSQCLLVGGGSSSPTPGGTSRSSPAAAGGSC
jgi:hypothetical protein